MNYLVIAIIAMICYGIADFLLKKGMNSGINGMTLMFYVWLMVSFLFGIFLYHKSVSFKIDKLLLSFAIPSAVLVFFGAIAIVYALNIGNASIVIPISRLGLVITALCAFIFMKEQITLNNIIGIAFGVLAIFFLTRT